MQEWAGGDETPLESGFFLSVSLNELKNLEGRHEEIECIDICIGGIDFYYNNCNSIWTDSQKGGNYLLQKSNLISKV